MVLQLDVQEAQEAVTPVTGTGATGAASAAVGPRAQFAQLEERLHGRLILPSETDYDSARRVWAASVDRYPAAVVRAATQSDVAMAVRFARSRELPIAIRSGGHSMAGYGTINRGLVIDLSGMKGMWLDPEGRVARVQPGLTWGGYAARAHEYGLATPSGDAGSVGVGGLTLGGGIGFLVRKHGLTIDHLRSANIVTADGQRLTVSERDHPDLFWAIRGGGGNFGVVTTLEFDMVPVGTIVGGAIVHEATAENIQGYYEAALRAPEELTTIAMVMLAPPLPFIPAEKHGTPVLLNLVCYTGDPEAGTRALAPLRTLGGSAGPLGEHVGPMPYPAIYELTAEAATSHRHKTRSGYAAGMTRELAASIAESVRGATSPFGFVQLRPLGGAMARVPQEATAFAHRDKQLLIVVVNAWDDPAQDDLHRAWTDATWGAIAPASRGNYVNFLEAEGEARIRDAYAAATFDRLAAIKRRYDPDNVFHTNQNIRPA